VKLSDVYSHPGSNDVLYDLLREREPHESISHRSMPTWRQHCRFVDSRPYLDWRIVVHEGLPRGAVYLTKQRELGVGILKEHRGHKFASRALSKLMEMHAGGHFLANINPANQASIALFLKLGFGGPIQITLEKP
jgi:RimJ/RimL family protein N-acetyltransferase